MFRDPYWIFPIKISLPKITDLVILDEADDVKRHQKSMKN